MRLVGHERQAALGLDRSRRRCRGRRCATRPAVGRRMPASDRSVVVLPAPLGPMSPTISPAPTSNDRSSTAVNVPAVASRRSGRSARRRWPCVLRLRGFRRLLITWLRMHPRSKRIVRVSRTASATASSVRGCAARSGHPRRHRRQRSGRAKTALKQTISLIDKMASKGIIHRNAAGRYKSRLTTRLSRRLIERRIEVGPDVRRTAPRPRPLPAAQLDDQPFEQHARVAGRALEVEVGPEQRLDGGRQLRRRERGKLRPHQPAELSEDLLRRRARVEHQRQLPQRVAAPARLRSRWSSPSRPAAPPARPPPARRRA